MKLSAFIIFITIVLSIYALINIYIVSRGLQVLPQDGLYRLTFFLIALFFILAYPVGRLSERVLNKGIVELLIHVGSYYLAMMIFAFFLIMIIDIFRLGNYFFHYFPKSWYQIGSHARLITVAAVTSIVLILTIIGAINAKQVRIKEFDIHIAKNAHSLTQFNIVLASDIHLGTIINNSRLETIVNKIIGLHPDIILLAGDVFDEDITTLVDKNIASILANLKSKYGVYAIPGNHEYYSGIEKAMAYLKQANIVVLRDSVSFVADSIYIVGRDDITGNRFGSERKPLDELLKNVDRDYPIILMDHQPFRLEEVQKNGIDLQVSGHTHHGQIFPFNFITNKVFELSWGYLQKGDTHYYVSCGVGTWGPPVRLGSRPEIIKIQLHLVGKNQSTAKSNE